MDTLSIQVHDLALLAWSRESGGVKLVLWTLTLLAWFRKSGGVKLVLGTQTSPLSEMM
jgi:hypothetical protein